MADQPQLPDLPGPPEAPEWGKAIRWLHHHYLANKEVLLKPPVLFAGVVIAVLAYWAGSNHAAEQIGVKDERISFLTDELTAYKDRLEGASPDEAAKQISTLRTDLKEAERKIQLLMPDRYRHLTAGQKKYISDHKDEIAKLANVFFVYAWTLGDSPFYALEFVQELQKNKIAVVGPILTVCGSSNHGVMVGLKDVDNPSQNAVKFKEILKNMGIEAANTKWEQMPGTQPDFDLFVCG